MQKHVLLLELSLTLQLRDGVNFPIRSISCTKQSNLLMHFLRMEKCVYLKVCGTIQCSLMKCLSMEEDYFSEFNRTLVQVPEIENGVMMSLKRLSFLWLILSHNLNWKK